MAHWPILILAGVVAGVFSGFFGIGGGIVLVPFLIAVTGLTQHAANGTSLVALLFPVGILGVWEYYRSGKIGPENIRAGLWIALGIVLGAFLGSKLAVRIPENLLRKAFAILLVLVALRLWFLRR